MGPNGSGKSTLCHVLTGKAGYVVSGEALLEGTELLSLTSMSALDSASSRASSTRPRSPALRLREFLLEAAEERGISEAEATERIDREAARFDVTRFLDRAINNDLSGGEMKRSEIFQMAVLTPRVALLDEIDSGLDIDAVKQVARAVEEMRSPDLGVLMITHYNRILRYVTPDRIHVMIGGRIVDSGGAELAEELEAGGYKAIRERLGLVETSSEPARRPADFFTDTPFDV